MPLQKVGGFVYGFFTRSEGVLLKSNNLLSEPDPEKISWQMKHPRAANFAWRCLNGKFLYWYHNHGGNWYEDRSAHQKQSAITRLV